MESISSHGGFVRNEAHGNGAVEPDGNGESKTDLLAFARDAVGLGFAVLPTIPGERFPDLKTWKPYQNRLPTPQELETWFTPAQQGIGVVCGKGSGNIEALDFDSHDAFDWFCELTEREDIGDLLRRVMNGYRERSPRGTHLLYRSEAVTRNTTLASVYARDDVGAFLLNENGARMVKALAETRGEGGFIVIAPSYGNTHKSGRPYTLVSGTLASIATITPQEREALFAVARKMNEVFKESKSEKRERAALKKSGTGRPGDVYNASADVTWASILVPHGWVKAGAYNGVTHWTRPGKERGTSATTGYAGTDLLYVFSTATVLESERGYTKFSAYTFLNHKGDFQKAAADLMRQGYFVQGEEPPWPEEDGAPAPEPEGFTRPKIRITTDITRVVNDAENALLHLPHGPHIFQRIGQLCFVTHSADPPKWLKRPLGAPSIASCSTGQLRERMSRAADWFKWIARSKEWTPALPAEWAVETLHGRGEWHFPVLADVISSPTLREDGEIISAPGYDPDTGLFLDTQGVVFSPISERPTLDDARRAVEALKEPFIDFPFKAEHGKSAALAALLSLVARPAISGCVPLVAVDSTTRGTGKGLLIDVVSTIATGRLAPRWAQTRDGEEDRKALLTIGMEGDACVHIDNLTHALGSGPLDSALTAGVIKGRLLGLNKSAEAPMNCVFFASGNNISFAGDMARRVVPIHLESLLERPEERTDFVQPQLLAWVRQERPRLVVEALTLLRAFCLAGRPSKGLSGYGSFQEWSDLVRAALVWAGCDDPCEGRNTIEAEADPGYEHLARLLHCWWTCYESKAVTLSSVIGDIGQRGDIASNQWSDLGDSLGAFDTSHDGNRLDVRRLGHALRAVQGRVIGGQRLIQAGESHRAVLWAIQQV